MASASAHIRLHSPDDLIDTVPYLLGFYPSRSLVLVGLTSDPTGGRDARRVSVSVRLDLPGEPHEEELSDLRRMIARSDATSVVALVYPPPAGPDESLLARWHWLWHATADAFKGSAISLLDVVLVQETRWWSLGCDCGYCRGDGNPRPVQPSAAVAEAVMAGLVALPDRDQLTGLLDGDPITERAELDPFIARAETRVVRASIDNRMRQLRSRQVADIRRAAESVAIRRPTRQAIVGQAAASPASRRVGLGPAQLARFGVALTDRVVRDQIWLAVDVAGLDAAPLMMELLKRLPQPYDAAPLFLFGWQQWRRGNGTLAVTAAERAMVSDPAYSAARLLRTAVMSGVSPARLPSLTLSE
jgi:hypothetical protein